MKNLFLLYWFAVAYHFKMIVISRATALFRYARRSHMIYACHSGMKIICRLSIDSFQIKSLLILGAVRPKTMEYPNREWGYGQLNLYNTFEVMRQL